MPTYQYACTECGQQLEAVQTFTEPALTECPACQGRLRKVFNSVGIVFKGSGFYRNDSRAGASSSEGASDGAKKVDATTSASKSDAGSNGSGSSSSSSSSDSSSGSSGSGSSGSGSSGSGSSGSGSSGSGSSGSGSSGSGSSGSGSSGNGAAKSSASSGASAKA